MPRLIQFCQRSVMLIDSLNEGIGRLISWLTLFMVLLTFTVVILRYAFDIGWVAMQESVIYLHSLVFMLGAAYTLKNGGHVRVDIIYQRCSRKARAWIDCLGTLLLLMPVAVFIFSSSWDYVLDSWAIQEGSRNSGGIPAVYLLKTSILIMAALLILQGTAIIMRNLLAVFGLENPLENRHG